MRYYVEKKAVYKLMYNMFLILLKKRKKKETSTQRNDQKKIYQVMILPVRITNDFIFFFIFFYILQIL